jgi:hypothetical protein
MDELSLIAEDGSIVLFNATTLVRRSDLPQITGNGVLCDRDGCALPHKDSPLALLQEEASSSPQLPPLPERASRSPPKHLTLKDLAMLGRTTAGLGAQEQWFPPEGLAAVLLQDGGNATATRGGEVAGQNCYWGPGTLMATLEGCVPNDNCKVYNDRKEAEEACERHGVQCGGIIADVKTKAKWQIRKGRWLIHKQDEMSIQKMACGKWSLKAEKVGDVGPNSRRGCGMKRRLWQDFGAVQGFLHNEFTTQREWLPQHQLHGIPL